MSQRWQPPAELRLAAAWGSLDLAIAGLIRTVEHLRQAERPGLEPLKGELHDTTERLAGLRRLIEAVWQGEKDLEP